MSYNDSLENYYYVRRGKPFLFIKTWGKKP